MKMNQTLTRMKDYIKTHSDLFVGIAVVAGLIAFVIAIVLAVRLSAPQVVYQPVKACNVFTPEEAKSLLGEDVIGVDSNEPKIVGNVATSKCSYTDTNPIQEEMMIAAVAVQSGINDRGVAENKAGYINMQKSVESAQAVDSIGDRAYFDPAKGQLNVLKGHQWYIFSYGVGESIGASTLEKVLELARKVVP